MGGVHCDKLQVLEMSGENGFFWTVKAELPDVRHSSASAVVQGRLWHIGGVDETDTGTVSLFIYDPGDDSWATGPPLPRVVEFPRAATHDGEVHLIGRDGALHVHRDGAWVERGGSSPVSFPTLGSVRLG